MATDKERNQNLIDNVVLADNNFTHLFDDIFAHGMESFHSLLKLCSI